MKVKQLSNLTPLRAFAATAVFQVHVELGKKHAGYEHFWNQTSVNLANQAVTLFFVLSGFLISYLLFIEKENKGKVSLKNFYLKRVFRIWPLYFIILIIGILYSLFYDLEIKAEAVLLYALFLTNLSSVKNIGIPLTVQSWSVSVEEQFYLVWPWLFKFKKKIIIVVSMLAVIFGCIFFRNVAAYLAHERPFFIAVNKFFNISLFGSMGIGGVFAFLFLFHNEKIQFLRSKPIQLLTLLGIFLLLYFGIFIPYFNYEIYSILFVLLIYNLVHPKTSILNLEHKPIQFLGEISYGIYMYNLLAIKIAIEITKNLFVEDLGIWGNIFLYLTSFLFTVIISSASYYWIEKKFLNMKPKS